MQILLTFVIATLTVNSELRIGIYNDVVLGIPHDMMIMNNHLDIMNQYALKKNDKMFKDYYKDNVAYCLKTFEDIFTLNMNGIRKKYEENKKNEIQHLKNFDFENYEDKLI